jgi:hypothetical protein
MRYEDLKRIKIERYESDIIGFIEKNFKLINKDGQIVPFQLNKIQRQFLTEDASGRDITLKARQQGFSSLALAIFTGDFLNIPNSESAIVADISDNATDLLTRVKFYIKSYEEINKRKVNFKYNSKFELANEELNSRIIIGTAENVDFGRSKTLRNLLFSEAAFYPQFRRLLAGALQAVVPHGRVIIETTANGFNEFKEFWTESELDLTGFKPNFYPASAFYSQEFLDLKKKELGKFYPQEYPENSLEAFMTSGSCFFDLESLKYYLKEANVTQI